MALTAYLTQVQNLLNTGAAGNLYPTTTLTNYINTARGQIASEGQCVRVLSPINGPITAVTITSGGSGYGNGVQVVISSPDSIPGFGNFPGGQQASATLTTGAGGSITAITLVSTGVGYFAPVVTFSGGSGSGVTTIVSVSGISQTIINQEVYPFSNYSQMASTVQSGVASVLMVNSINMIWGTWRYTLNHVSFSRYQARNRSYAGNSYTDIPRIWTQYGQGETGSFYVYPVPNASYQMEVDMICVPNDLSVDTDPEAIPYPWTDCIRFLAAYLACSGSGRYADADRFWKQYQMFMARARQMSQSRAVTSWYGRVP